MLRKMLEELWDIFKYFAHLETMKHCNKYERYYPESEQNKIGEVK